MCVPRGADYKLHPFMGSLRLYDNQYRNPNLRIGSSIQYIMHLACLKTFVIDSLNPVRTRSFPDTDISLNSLSLILALGMHYNRIPTPTPAPLKNDRVRQPLFL